MIPSDRKGKKKIHLTSHNQNRRHHPFSKPVTSSETTIQINVGEKQKSVNYPNKSLFHQQ